VIAIPGRLGHGLRAGRRTKDVLMWMLSTKMMPAVGVLVPIYLIFRDTGCSTRRTGLVIVLTLINLPIIVWMLYTYFREIPARSWKPRGWTAPAAEGDPLCADADGGAGHRLDPASQHHPRLERGVLDAEPDHGQGGAADRLHRQLFQPRGPVLRQAVAASTMAIAPILILGWFSQKQLVRGLTFGAVK
jgi:sorbitol/mannitol transport system permease protein